MPRGAWRDKGADLAFALIVKAALSFAVIARGLSAISDDDFARTLIAQRFALSPHWDPSGSSWLPFPFWISGSALMAFGKSLEVARAAAFATGLASAALVYAGALVLELSRAGRLLGTLLAALVPWFVWVSVTTTPEALTAGLLVFAAATATSTVPRTRLLGALAIALACLSRYEAWPVAALFAVFSTIDACRERSATLALTALFALFAPALWLTHGLLAHGDALFFVTRVVSYRQALGGSALGVADRLWVYPRLLVQVPALIALLFASAFAALRLDPTSRPSFTRLLRPAALLAGLFVFLVVGELRDGAPTHHAERALLPIWLMAALVSGESLARSWSAARSIPVRAGLLLCGTLTALLLATRALSFGAEGFANRELEVDIGRRAAALAPTAGAERLLVATNGYGYFAVMVGFARPEQAAPWIDHDPRRAAAPDPLRSPESMRESLRQGSAQFYVVPVAHAVPAQRVGVERARNAAYALFELGK